MWNVADYVVWLENELRIFESFNTIARAKRAAQKAWKDRNPDSYANIFWQTRRDGTLQLCVDDGLTSWADSITIKRAED